jgi:pantothenate synthetase
MHNTKLEELEECHDTRPACARALTKQCSAAVATSSRNKSLRRASRWEATATGQSLDCQLLPKMQRHQRLDEAQGKSLNAAGHDLIRVEVLSAHGVSESDIAISDLGPRSSREA